MAIRKIVKLGDDVLRKECRVQEKFDLRLAILLKDMADTMYRAEGVGLAAPQVGVLRRVCVIDVGEGLYEMVNPVIVEREGSQCGREGCLSLPGRQGVVTRPYKVKVQYQDCPCDPDTAPSPCRGVVTRPYKVKVQYQDRKGNPCELEAEGFLARAVCHELDHLDGRVYIDVMDRELTPEEIEGHIPEDDDE